MGNMIFVATSTPTPVETIQTALQNGFTSTAGDIMSTLALVIPIAIGVWGAFLLIRYAKNAFSAVSNKK